MRRIVSASTQHRGGHARRPPTAAPCGRAIPHQRAPAGSGRARERAARGRPAAGGPVPRAAAGKGAQRPPSVGFFRDRRQAGGGRGERGGARRAGRRPLAPWRGPRAWRALPAAPLATVPSVAADGGAVVANAGRPPLPWVPTPAVLPTAGWPGRRVAGVGARGDGGGGRVCVDSCCAVRLGAAPRSLLGPLPSCPLHVATGSVGRPSRSTPTTTELIFSPRRGLWQGTLGVGSSPPPRWSSVLYRIVSLACSTP